jgi:hypothetical protein
MSSCDLCFPQVVSTFNFDFVSFFFNSKKSIAIDEVGMNGFMHIFCEKIIHVQPLHVEAWQGKKRRVSIPARWTMSRCKYIHTNT